jgi:hypothetical protein
MTRDGERQIEYHLVAVIVFELLLGAFLAIL